MGACRHHRLAAPRDEHSDDKEGQTTSTADRQAGFDLGPGALPGAGPRTGPTSALDADGVDDE